jgi:hypothetical protein
MLKCLAIVTVALMLVVFQSNGQPHKAQQANSGQKPASPISNPPIEQKSSHPLKSETNQHVDADVRVLKTPEKDFYDKVAFWISVVLAGVGFAGVGVGIGTLLFLRSQVSEMKRQANLMETQAGHMSKQADLMAQQLAEMKSGSEIAKDNAEAARVTAKASAVAAMAAEKSADAALAQIQMMKDKERAQLRIEFGEPQLTFDEEKGGYPVPYRITLDGATRAYIPQNAAIAYVGRTARTKRNSSWGLSIPQNFTPHLSPFEGYILLRKEDGWPEIDVGPDKSDMVQH